ncbi:MAG: hypothetical protein RL095_1881 [Verrucomicrobiota bacterium]|jgi:hypothetical protein
MVEPPSEIALIFWRILFLCLAALSIAAAFSLPRGFPLSSAHFWCNSLLPIILILFSCTSIAFIVRRQYRLFLVCALAFLGGIAAFLASAWLIFPATMRASFIMPALFSCMLLVWWIRRSLLSIALRHFLPLLVIAIAAGSFVPWAQRGLDPATRPLGGDLGFSKRQGREPDSSFHFSGDGIFFPADGSIVWASKEAKLSIDPLLVFRSRSPDRCWTLLARDRDRLSSPWILDAVERSGNGWSAYYSEAGRVTRRLGFLAHMDGFDIEALSQEDNEVYSHLNSFCQFRLAAVGRLSLSFSPCPGSRIEIVESDYPVGRPARFAYVDRHRIFHVVEAASAEKGPFRTLAEGRLSDDELLTMSLYCEGRELFTIEMADWARQASTQLSPSAGWGLPENAIEFRLKHQTAWISCTLAGTSVGRGFQSVGHRAGSYRNRLRLRIVNALSGSTASGR